MPNSATAAHQSLRIPIIFGMTVLFSGLYCLYYATVYADLQSAKESVNRAFNSAYVGNKAVAPLSNKTIETINTLGSYLPYDSEAQTTVLKARMVNWKLGEACTPDNLEHALKMISQTEQIQPTHYQAFVIRTVLLHHFGSADQLFIDQLDKGLAIAPFEWEFQSLVAPILVTRWHSLPSQVQEKALPIIRGALRQKPTRELLIATMEREKNVSPFIKLSPGKWITKRLRKIESELASNEV